MMEQKNDNSSRHPHSKELLTSFVNIMAVPAEPVKPDINARRLKHSAEYSLHRIREDGTAAGRNCGTFGKTSTFSNGSIGCLAQKKLGERPANIVLPEMWVV